MMTSAKTNIKAKKMMLLIGMVSMTMTFAGLTSAYVVSSSRSDWLISFEMPSAFTISTFILILSSVTFSLAKHFNSIDSSKKSFIFVLLTMLLAFTFIFYQFRGFGQIIDSGYYFTGPQSSITTSFLYVLVLLHLLHLIAGILVLFFISFNLLKGKYSTGNTLGIELGVVFWHFLDFLWCYLYLFVVLYK
jgi:cytochrome c oxidase subunit 3